MLLICGFTCRLKEKCYDDVSIFYVYIYVYLNVTEIANKKNWACQNACKRGKMRSEFEGFFRLYMMVMVIIDTFIVLNKLKQ